MKGRTQDDRRMFRRPFCMRGTRGRYLKALSAEASASQMSKTV